MGKTENVVVLGASSNPERYSHRAVTLLKECGHRVIPVHPDEVTIDGTPVANDLGSVEVPVDTVTVYVNPERGAELSDGIIALGPKRVILNPGAESQLLERKLREHGIGVERACTLVLLSTGQF